MASLNFSTTSSLLAGNSVSTQDLMLEENWAQSTGAPPMMNSGPRSAVKESKTRLGMDKSRIEILSVIRLTKMVALPETTNPAAVMATGPVPVKLPEGMQDWLRGRAST